MYRFYIVSQAACSANMSELLFAVVLILEQDEEAWM